MITNTDHRTKRRSLILVALFILLGISMLGSISYGAVSISWQDILRIPFGETKEEWEQIIFNIRIPRMLTGILVGMNLALAGAIMQGVLRNPLADPGILGVTAGAGLGALGVMILFPEYVGLVPLIAFAGALGALFAVYLLAWKNGSIEPIRLILAGVALAAFFGGIMTTMMVFHSEKVQGTVQWMAGGFQGRSWGHVRMVLPYTFFGVIAAFWTSRTLNILALGDEVATGLGLNVRRSRLVLMTVAGFLTAAAVSVAGLLGFVGLMVPHIVRMVIGSDFEWLMPAAVLIGAILVVNADTFARIVFAPSEVPVGVFMSFIGAPFFLYLLRRGGAKG